MQVSSFQVTLPFCGRSGEQTAASRYSRITAAVLGVLLLLGAALALVGVFSGLDTIPFNYVALGGGCLGGVLLLSGLFLRYKENSLLATTNEAKEKLERQPTQSIRGRQQAQPAKSNGPAGCKSPAQLSNSFQILLSSIHKMSNTKVPKSNEALICFYKTGDTAFLGNFAPCPKGIKLWGKSFQCSEAAYQWGKFTKVAAQNPKVRYNPRLMNELFSCTGQRAFEISRELDRNYPKVVSNWIINDPSERDRIMWDVLWEKFDANPEFAALLNATGDAYLLEHNEDPKREGYWSDKHDGTGENMLGRMLMAIRDKRRGGQGVIPNCDHQKIQNFAGYANRVKFDIF